MTCAKKIDLIIGLFILLFIILLILTPFGAFFIQPVFEKRNYERITGIEVTYWDAFFVKLDPSAHLLLLERRKK